MSSAFGLQTPKDSELSIPHTWYAKLTYILIVWIHHIPNRHSDGRTWIWATYLLVIDKKKLYSYNLQVFSFNPLHSNLLCPIYKLQIDATSLVSLHELLKVWIQIGFRAVSRWIKYETDNWKMGEENFTTGYFIIFKRTGDASQV